MKKLLWVAVAAGWIWFTYHYPSEGAALLVLAGAYLFGRWVAGKIRK